MGDRIVVMKDGLIQQVGAPLQIYDHPNNVFVAGFIGSPAMNFFNVKLVRDGDNLFIDGETFKVRVPEEIVKEAKGIDAYVGKEVIFGLRPENIEAREFAPEAPEDMVITANVDVSEPMGAEVYLYLSSGQHNFVARVEPYTTAKDGSQHQVYFKMSKMKLFDPQTEKAIF